MALKVSATTGGDVQLELHRPWASALRTGRVNKRKQACLTVLFDALDTVSELAGG